ncbi:MAG: hypothetical protein J0M07_19245 [Anaerolineae bacterium]|nr:hypothetical protein [Anaerolineae bacterium]
MNDSQNRRFIEIMIGVFLLLAGLSSIGSAGVAALVFAAIGFWLISRNFEGARDLFQSSASTPSRRYEFPEEEVGEDDETFVAVQPRADQVYPHALDSVRRAGLDPSTLHVLPVDIGVMAFSADREPVIHRNIPIVDDVDYIQPFVQLRLPTKAIGRIRFEMIDADGDTVFAHENNQQLQKGLNLISPNARLPIHDQRATGNDWLLRVTADGVVIAEHRFSWQESASKAMRRHINADGELSNEIRVMMAENRLGKMSLDDLLSEQEKEEPPQRRSTRQS